MADRFAGRKVVGKRLGFMALTFAVLFFASSLEVYRDDVAQSRAKARVKESEAELLTQLGQTSKSAVALELWREALKVESKGRGRYVPSAQGSATKAATLTYYSLSASPDGRLLTDAVTLYEVNTWEAVSFSGHGSGWVSPASDIVTRLDAAGDKYEKALAAFAALTRVEKDGSSIVIWDVDGCATSLKNDSIEGYSYDRLFLESQRQRGRLSAREYRAGVDRLLREYVGRMPAPELTADARQFRSQLKDAEREIDKLRGQVASLEKQLAEAKQTPLERWLPTVAAVLSLLIALSANFLSWRADRRHSREAELLPLRRQELEQNIARQWRELKGGGSRVVTPTPQELQTYSTAVPRDDFLSRGGGPGPRYRRRL
jgi:hypothetical protein